jgi:hypothetical protein
MFNGTADPNGLNNPRAPWPIVQGAAGELAPSVGPASAEGVSARSRSRSSGSNRSARTGQTTRARRGPSSRAPPVITTASTSSRAVSA